jgi:hypothetical protein
MGYYNSRGNDDLQYSSVLFLEKEYLEGVDTCCDILGLMDSTRLARR